MTDQCDSFLVKSSWICAIPDRPDVPVSQNTVAHESKKETTTAFEHRLKVHELIFKEQMRIYNAKRLWVFHEKPSKHSKVFSPDKVNIKRNWPI